MAQFLDTNGLRVLWSKIKNLVENNTVSLNTFTIDLSSYNLQVETLTRKNTYEGYRYFDSEGIDRTLDSGTVTTGVNFDNATIHFYLYPNYSENFYEEGNYIYPVISYDENCNSRGYYYNWEYCIDELPPKVADFVNSISITRELGEYSEGYVKNCIVKLRENKYIIPSLIRRTNQIFSSYGLNYSSKVYSNISDATSNYFSQITEYTLTSNLQSQINELQTKQAELTANYTNLQSNYNNLINVMEAMGINLNNENNYKV